MKTWKKELDYYIVGNGKEMVMWRKPIGPGKAWRWQHPPNRRAHRPSIYLLSMELMLSRFSGRAIELVQVQVDPWWLLGLIICSRPEVSPGYSRSHVGTSISLHGKLIRFGLLMCNTFTDRETAWWNVTWRLSMQCDRSLYSYNYSARELLGK